VSASRLSEYPYVVVRIACHFCERRGSYRLARLAGRHGSEISLGELLERLAGTCPWRSGPGERRPGKYDPKCAPYYPDLINRPGPPDLPPAMTALRVVQGGRRE